MRDRGPSRGHAVHAPGVAAPGAGPRGRPARISSRTAARTLLRAAERLQGAFGAEAAAPKRALLAALESRRLRSAGDLLRLHELLCFWRAYPDDALVLAAVERLLEGFPRRADLRRHSRGLADTGVAGTAIHYRFYAPTARWLASRWPRSLTIDWPEFENRERIATWLPLLAHPAESPALEEHDAPPREWLRKMAGSETDAAFLIRRFARLPMDDFAREALYDELDVPLRLTPGPGTPSRTHAKIKPSRVSYQRRPLARARPSREEIRALRPVAVRDVAPREGGRLIDLAREAMVTRARDLDVFSYGDPRDVRVVDFGDGLCFACIGAIPERRLLLEAVYGYLTLKNGVPVGYVLTSALFGSSEIAYNVFETYRGAEAGPIYARVLAMTRHLFGSDTFVIVPYQLGERNQEAIRSGAWWFYRKMGFQPRDPATSRLMRRELRRMKRNPGHRSDAATLRRLARANLYLHLGQPRADVMGELPLPNAGLQVMRFLADRFGSDREEARRVCADEAAALLRAGSRRDFSPGERLAWERWAPLVLILPGLERWSPVDRRALTEVIRAKGGRRESEFVRRFDAHARLRRAMRALVARPVPG